MKNLTFLFLLISVGCSNPVTDDTTEKNRIDNNGKKESKVYDTNFWVTDGDIESDTILIISQGGPKWYLEFEEKGKTNYRYIPHYSNYGVAYVHQSQTISDRIITQNEVLTLEEARAEVQQNSEMLNQAISYFKERKKTVIVIGKSQGAYVVQDYLATKTPKADKYYILAGRLNINAEMTQQQLKGFCGGFSEDGITYIPHDEKVDSLERSEKEWIEYKNKQMLKAGYGATNYIDKLREVNLINVVYFYGTVDQNIGSLIAEEISFLEAKGVKTFKTEKNHSGVTYAFIDKLIDGTLEL